jgi:hypothetical protein
MRLHYHGLLYGTDSWSGLSPVKLERFWSHYGMAMIVPYLPGGGGAEYVFKTALLTGDWDHRRLERF